MTQGAGADLDGDVVVAPFRWQVLNADVAAKRVGSGTFVVLIFVDGEIYQDFLLDGTKKISVGFSGAELLAPGEYTVAVKLADESSGYWDGDKYFLASDPVLLDIESPARRLVVESGKGSFVEHSGFLSSQRRCAHTLSLLTALETSQASRLEALAQAWNGHVSAVVFVSAAEQQESEQGGGGRGSERGSVDARELELGSRELPIMRALRQMHARVEAETGCCLTISLLREVRASASTSTAPYHR